MYSKFPLKFKLIVYTLFFTVLSVFSVGYISNNNLEEHFSSDAKNQFREALFDLSFGLKNIEEDIIESARLISENEDIIGSMKLIKSDEDITNYDAEIFDEERKRILNTLLHEAKYSLSDHISIYDSEMKLVAFVNHSNEEKFVAFRSYVDSQPVYYSKEMGEKLYKKNDLVLKLEEEIIEELTTFVASETIEESLTYYKHKDIFALKVRYPIVKELANEEFETLGFIEMNKHFSKESLNKLIPLNMTIHYDFQERENGSQFIKEIPLLFSNFNIVDLHLYDEENIFFTKVKIILQDYLLILTIETDKHELVQALTDNKKTLILLLFIIVLITLAISLLVLNKMISIPLKKLLEGIEIISKGNYLNKININSKDELGHISKEFNKMAGVIAEREMQLDDLAHYDSLTKMPNRVMFLKRLNSSIKRAKRLNKKLAVFFLDLDDFKNINDTLGHHVGDKLLIEISKNLSCVMRENDVLSRIGGDEFNILIEDLDTLTYINEIAEKFIKQMMIPSNIEDNQIVITGSIGISIFPDDGTDATALLKNADLAMYKAKDSGRNRYSFFSKDLEISLNSRLHMLKELKNVVNKDELKLFYQPKFSLTDGSIYSAEALIRWESTELGFVTPDQFIPLAEESGDIIEIGAWVIQRACKDFVAWKKLGLNIEKVSVNVSNVQFTNDDVVEVLKKNILSSGISAQSLEVEITESFMQEDGENALEILKSIRALGVELAMDDFGTGYSSMSYLKRLPINRLKIDRSFISDIPHDSDDVEITKIIVSLAKIMGLSITAEGIETLDQLHFLQEMEVDEGQGYICSKPLANEEFIELLKNEHECIG